MYIQLNNPAMAGLFFLCNNIFNFLIVKTAKNLSQVINTHKKQVKFQAVYLVNECAKPYERFDIPQDLFQL